MKLLHSLSLPAKLFVIALTGALIWFIASKVTGGKSSQVQYITETAQKGTLIVAVSASGTISGANSASVTTQTSGVVSKIYVQNGQRVTSGDPIAEVELDMEGKQRAAQALASYQSAKNALDTAKANLYSAQSTMLTEWQQYMDKAQNSTYENADDSPNTTNRQLSDFVTTQDDWLSAEAKYKVQQNAITQAQTAVSSAWASYQQASPTIYAPISGTINGLSLQVGSVLTAQTSSTGNSTSQRIATIKTDATPMAVVNLSEIDVTRVHVEDKVTITMDAFEGKTFTGKVVSIDTTGSVSSGVTSYPAYIVFDTAPEGIYPNMAVDANIITLVKDNVILVPSAAVQTTDGASSVRVMKNGSVSSVPVEVGDASDTQTEIVSGVNDGDTVVTGTRSGTTGTNGSTTSPFSSFGGRGFGGGGNVRIIGR